MFLECTVATWCWREVCNIWSVSFSQIISSTFSFSGLLNLVSDVELKDAWHLVVVSIMWTVWLFRNDQVFNSKRPSREVILKVLKTRMYKWLEASNMISSEVADLLFVNPKGAIRATRFQQYHSFWEGLLSIYDWVVEVDGAVTKRAIGQTKAGI